MAWKNMAEMKAGDRFALTKSDGSDRFVLIAVHENGDWTVRNANARTDRNDKVWKPEGFAGDDSYWVE